MAIKQLCLNNPNDDLRRQVMRGCLIVPFQ